MVKVSASASALRIARKVLTLVTLVCLATSLVAAQGQNPTTTSGTKPTAPAGNVTNSQTPTPTATTHFNIPTGTPTSPTPAPGGGGGVPMGPGGLPDFAKMWPLGNTTRCPAPLVPNFLNRIDIKTCLSGCCLKCPVVENFYAPKEMGQIVDASYYVRNVSLAFAIFMTLSYLILPGKRSQPHVSVLFLTISISLWFASMNVMKGTSNACVNDIEQSTGHNSATCGFQGVAITYFTQTSALWCSLLIYKLHLLAVWRSDWIDRHYRWCVAFCWILPLCFAIPIIALRLQEYPGIGFSCLVKVDDLNTYIFYPIAVYMYPALMCHIITVVKMVQLAVMSSKVDTGLSQLSANAQMKITTTMQAKRLLRGQWRPAFMLGAVMASLTVFWMFYFIDARKLNGLGLHTPWLAKWLTCVFTQNAAGQAPDEVQRFCSAAIKTNLPSIVWFTAAEMLLALLGIVIGLVFMSKSEFWAEWHFLFYNLLTRGKSGGSSQDRRSPGGGGPGNGSPASPTMMIDSQRLHREAEMNRYANSISKSMARKDDVEHQQAPGTQWYDMDDLLDKEYEEHGNNNNKSTAMLNRYPSDGSRKALTSGDILYSPPSATQYDGGHNNMEGGGGGWTPSPHVLSSPTKAYLTPVRDNDRYVDDPIVPAPVPRARHQQSRGAGDYSSPPHSPTSAPPTSRSFGSIGGGDQDAEVVYGVATRGSAAMAAPFQHQPSPPLQGFPTPPSHQSSPSVPKARIVKAYNSNESAFGDGRTFMGASSTSPRVLVNTGVAPGGPSSPPSSQRAKSPPPYVPMKSPARTQFGSGPIHLSTPHS